MPSDYPDECIAIWQRIEITIQKLDNPSSDSLVLMYRQHDNVAQIIVETTIPNNTAHSDHLIFKLRADSVETVSQRKSYCLGFP